MKTFVSIFVVAIVAFLGVVRARADSPPDTLIAALIQKESKGKDKAIGDTQLPDHAYGPLQIRQPCVDDVNRVCCTYYKASDCLGNRTLSIWICREYINMYATKTHIGHVPTTEDMARIWNGGGPQGFKISRTLRYWADIKKLLGK